MRGREALPLQWAVASGVIRASARGAGERALFARLELSAFMRGATHVHDTRQDGCYGWWFAHRVFGVGTGMVEAACCAGGPASATAAGDRLLGGAKVVKLMSLRDDSAGMQLPGVTLFRDVLPLAGDHDSTLLRFGSRTRRNIRHVRRAAASHGLSFALLRDRAPAPREEIRALAARTRPLAMRPNRIDKLEQFVHTAGGGFHSVLRARSGGLVSYCRGFLEARTAYVIYQLNDADWHDLSPSLLHRSHLIEALTGLGARELIFVHGCSGVLHRACDPMPVEQAWIMQPGLSAHLLTQAVARLLPPGGYRHLAAEALRRPAVRCGMAP